MGNNGFNIGKSYWQNQPASFIKAPASNSADKKAITPLKPAKYHNEFKGLEIDEKGNVIKDQFRFNYLKTRFSAAGYAVRKTKEGIIVYKNGKPEAKYEKDRFGNTTYSTYENGKIKQSIEIEKGKIISSKTFNDDGSTVQLRYVKGNTKKVDAKFESFPDGNTKHTYYRENGDIEYVLDKEGRMDYAANKPFWSFDPKGSKFPGLKTLKDAINSRNFNLVKKIAEQGIHSGNIFMVLDEYKKLGNNSDLIKELKTFGTEGMKIIEGIEQQISETGEKGVGYIAKVLYEDIKGLGSGDLKRHIKMINNYNVGKLMEAYKRTAYNDRAEGHRAGLDNIEDLLTAIDGEWINPAAKTLMVKHIVNAALENTKNKYVDDIKTDLYEHWNNKDWHKLSVDIVRLCNRAENSEDSKFIKPNGKFDNYADQRTSGDCYLVSTVNAMITKPKMKKALEDMITILPNGDAKVYMKGNNKTYTISAKEIENSNYLASGDGDMRILEIAYDKYRRDEAYNDKDFIETYGVGDGGVARSFVEACFGEGKDEDYDFLPAKDFNPQVYKSNPDTAYVFGLGMGYLTAKGTYYALNEKGEKVLIEHKHGYSVAGADEKGIYLRNPWHSSELLTVTMDEYEKMKGDAVYFDGVKLPSMA